MLVQIFTDGSAHPNPGAAGYGTILLYGTYRKEISQGFKLSTNNRMELMGAIAGLEALTKEGLDIEITTDSRYVVDSVMKGWCFNWERQKWKDRTNADLWIRFLVTFRKQKNVKMIWVKGHNNHPENERCDRLAVAASNKIDVLIDTGYKK